MCHEDEGGKSTEDASTLEPMVSIIVPAYNAVQHLERCVASLWAQTYGNIEIILVDDGSTDGTGELCDILTDRHARTSVLHLSNGGVSNARNKGIAQSRGELIQFADADDHLDSGMTAALVATHLHYCVDLVICGYKEVAESGAEIAIHGVAEMRLLNREQFLVAFRELRDLSLINSGWNKLYSGSLIRDRGILFPTSINLAEDAVFNLEYMRLAESVAVIPDTLYTYVRYSGDGTLSTRWRPDLYDACRLELESTLALMNGHQELSAEREREYALNLATQVVPHLAMHVGRQGYGTYVRRAAEIRQDPLFARYGQDLQARDVRARVLLPLFRSSRFEAIAVFMGVWSVVQRAREATGLLRRQPLPTVEGS